MTEKKERKVGRKEEGCGNKKERKKERTVGRKEEWW